MKPLYALPLLFLVGLPAHAHAQIVRTYGVPAGRPDTYGAMMIGTAVGPAKPRTFFSKDRPRPVYFAVQPVRVTDSVAFRPGTLVDVCLPYVAQERNVDLASRPDGPIGQEGALPIGRSVLILAGASPQKGVLRAFAPGSETLLDYTYDKQTLPGPVTAGNVIFETHRTRLAQGNDPMWRMLESVAEAIPGTSDANLRKIADFVEFANLPEWGASPADFRVDDRFSTLFAKATSNESPYRRALVDYALNSLLYVGYDDRFYRDVYAASVDPEAFPDGVPVLRHWEQPTDFSSGLPKGFKHDRRLHPSQIMALLKEAQSPGIVVWLLKDLPNPDDEGDVRSLARFLSHPDRDLQWAVVERLAAWHGEPEPEKPRWVVDDDALNSHWEYPGLDAAVARWKARLGS